MADEIGGVVLTGVAFYVGALERARDGLREDLGDETLRRAAPPVPFDACAGFVRCGHGEVYVSEQEMDQELASLTPHPRA